MYVRILTIFMISKFLSPMTSDVSKSFLLALGGTYVLPFQVPKPPKKVLKGENKGGTPLVIFASPL